MHFNAIFPDNRASTRNFSIRRRRQRPSLERVLTENFKVPPDTLLKARTALAHQDCTLADVLLSMRAIDPDTLRQARAFQWGCEQVEADQWPAAADIANTTPLNLWIRFNAFPIVVRGTPTLACADPDQLQALWKAAPSLRGLTIAISDHDRITAAISEQYGTTLINRAETRIAEHESCRHWNTRTVRRMAAWLGVLAVFAGGYAPTAAFLTLTVIALTAMALISVLRVLSSIFGSRAKALSTRPLKGIRPVVTLLVPLYKEREIAGHLIKRLEKLTYPKSLLEVCLILEADDDTTRTTLDQITRPHWMRQITVPTGGLRTKPRAMNYALPFTRGQIIGVLDAEDAPEPDQICRMVDHMRRAGPDVACVQGVLDYYNSRRNWMARCFSIEYATWFRVLLPGLDKLGLIVPLGGTTLYFRRAVLEELGGWDAHNVTEDADLGVRLARHGYRTECITATTYEEANCRPWPWIRQRSRWIKGFMMTYATHMRAPIHLIRDIGLWQFLGLQVLLLGTILQFTFAPILWSYWAIALGLPHPAGSYGAPLMGLFIGAVAVSLTVNLFAVRDQNHRHLIPWLPLMGLYNPLGTLAAYKALYELLFKPFYWDKTRHGHLSEDQ